MNLVGKIFTVLIFLMCIVFATFALMVHAAHKNWREEIIKKGGLNDQLVEANKVYKDLRDEQTLLQARLDDERKGSQRRITALAEAAKGAIAQRDASDARLAEEAGKVRELTATIKETAARLNVLQVAIDGMRAEIKVAVDQRSLTQKQLIDTNDKLLNAVAERERLEKLQRELAKQLTDARTALGIVKVPLDILVKNGPVGAIGEVTGVVRDVVEISLGADDGIRKGFKFIVTRPSTGKYIGKIDVIQVDSPNRAVCRPDKASLSDQIQRGDKVELETKPR